jgi:hypothetical protein
MLFESFSAARGHKALLSKRATSFIAIVVIVAALLAVVMMSTTTNAATGHTITFVNNSGEALWIGSTTNMDGSRNLDNLPVLVAGESVSLTIPDNQGPNHWRGRFAVPARVERSRNPKPRLDYENPKQSAMI